MATASADLARWFQEGVRQGATHMIVACDTFDYEDFPVYVMAGEDARARAAAIAGGPMSKVMEVYDLRQPAGPQLQPGRRVFNY